jgi:nucleotide-binding universal stress UspA family protein
MAHHAMRRLYTSVTRAAQLRDRIEIQGINRLLAPLGRQGTVQTMSGAAARRIARSGFRSILCPVDFSAPSRLALRYAARIAKRSHGRLSILYVNDPLLIAAAGIALHDRTLAARNLAELRRFVESTASARVVDMSRVHYAVASGKPAGEIIKAAARARCDLIVMGTHGFTGADKLFIGSTTEGVFRRSRVPVLAVRGTRTNRNGALAPERSWPGERIIVPVALDRRSLRDARAAARVARWLGSVVLLVHVVPDVKSSWWSRERAGTSDRTRVERAQSRLAALGVGVLRDAPVQTRVLVGDTTREIAKIVATERAGLVITTRRTPRDWFGPRRGSISYDVLSHVPTPVLALPG